MDKQIPLDAATIADSVDEHGVQVVRPDIAWQRTVLVNVAYIGHAGHGLGGWVLIDTGVPGSARAIRRTAARRFGEGSRPLAIVMTHGHFDHAGSVVTLAEEWRVPVYAHELELPYLDGRAAYPPADPTVGGGMFARLSPLFPTHPYDARPWVRAIPHDGIIAELPDWVCLHTPGHTPGHVSLWRESDRTLLSGDAFITTRQESAYAVLTRTPEMHGPPRYLTQNWDEAHESVRQLSTLDPELVVPGHGEPMEGPAMRAALITLAEQFAEIAVPDDGRYVRRPIDAGSPEAYRMKEL